MTATPRSTKAATALLERYADLDSRLALVELDRNERIAQANLLADVAAAPMLRERDGIAAGIQAWFGAAGKDLLPKGRKSMELGGCMLGTRATRTSLTITGD